MDRSNEKWLLTAAALCGMALFVDHLLWLRTQSSVIPALYPYLTLAATLCLMLWGRIRLRRLADEEARDLAAVERAAGDRSLFPETGAEMDPVSYGHAQRQFEKWAVPLLAPLIAPILAFWGHRLFAADTWMLLESEQGFFAAAILIGQAFVLFLFGRYFLGVGRTPEGRLLRGSGNILSLAAMASALAGLSTIIAESGYPIAESILRRALAAYTWVLAGEFILNTIGFLYRPRRPRDLVLTYESRLTALITDPRSWTDSIAQALDYQFGFRVSETGFYRFLQRALLPLLILQALLLYALSCIVVLGPEETAIKERLGNPMAPDGTPTLLSSGFHLKWPWPFEHVRRFPSKRILTTQVGYTPDPEMPHPSLILWTHPHHLEEDQFVVAQRAEAMIEEENDTDMAVPVNFITVSMAIEYRVSDLYQYLYVHRYPDELLRTLAQRELTRELTGRDLIELLGTGRLAAADVIASRLQERVDALELGVDILFLGLHGAHPPIPVAAAFESVIGSFEERQTATLQARAYRNRILPMARAEAAERVWAARAYGARRVKLAHAESDWFHTRLRIHRELPDVYVSRVYLETLQRALQPVRKYVIAAAPEMEVLIFNLEEKLRPDLFDFGPGRLEDPFL